MALTLSPAHEAARQEAARLPSLQASFALLTPDPEPAVIQLFVGTPVSGTLVAELPMPDTVLTLDSGAVQIKSTAVIEGQVSTAGNVSNARILDGTGAWWADGIVTDEQGSGDIKMQDTNLQAGAFAQITNAIFQG